MNQLNPLLSQATSLEDRITPDVDLSISREIASTEDDDLDRMLGEAGIDVNAIKKKHVEETKGKALEDAIVPGGVKVPEGSSSTNIPTEVVTQGVLGGVTDVFTRVANGVKTAYDYVGNAFMPKEAGKLATWDALDPKQIYPESDEPAAKMARATVGYVAPLAAGMAAGGGFAVRNAIPAAINFLGIDPKEQRLSDFIQEVPALRNPVAALLASDPKDTELQSRIKNVIEGLILQGVGETALAGGKAIFAKKTAQTIVDAVEAEKSLKNTLSPPDVPPTNPPDSAPPVAQGAADSVGAKAVEEQIIAIDNVVEFPIKYDPKAVGKATTVDEASQQIGINLTKIGSSDDARMMIAQFAEQNKEAIDKIRPTMTFKEIEEYAGELLGDPESARKLLAIQQKEGKETLAAQVVAHKMLVGAAVDDLVKTADLITKSPDNPEYIAKFADSIQSFGLFTAAMRQKQTEIAVAQSAGRIIADAKLPMSAKAKMFEEAIKLGGGKNNLQNTAKMIQNVLKIPDSMLVEKAGQLQKLSRYQRFGQAASFYVLNNILSLRSVGTAMIGNAFNMAADVSNNLWAAAIGTMSKDAAKVTFGEVGQKVYGQMSSLMEAFSVAAKSFKQGRLIGPAANLVTKEGTVESITKFDIPFNNPISAENFGINDESNFVMRMLGWGLDKFGVVEGLPSRMLLMADAFTGTVTYRGSLHSQLYAKGTQQGLKGKDLNNFIKEGIKNVDPEMHFNAVKNAQEINLANPLEGPIGDLQREHPIMKAIFPVMTTTWNEVKFVASHSPFVLAHSPTRKAILAGGREGQLAAGRVLTGLSGVGVLTYLASQGVITGEVPSNPKLAKALKETSRGWQPNSIKVGEGDNATYISMDKFGLMASFMRIGAFLNESKNYVSQEEYSQMMIAAGYAVADSLTPESYIEGMGDTFSAIATLANQSSSKMDQTQALSELQDMAGRLVPLAGTMNTFRHEVDPVVVDKSSFAGEDFFTKLKVLTGAKIPYYSSTLPAQVNVFGDIVHSPSMWGPDLISPMAVSYGKSDPVIEKIKDLANVTEQLGPVDENFPEFSIKMPPKTLKNKFDGEPFELTREEYSRFVTASAGRDPRTGDPVGGTDLKQFLGGILNQVDIKKVYKEDRDYAVLATKKVVMKVQRAVSKFQEQGMGYILKDAEVFRRMREEAEARQLIKNRRGQ